MSALDSNEPSAVFSRVLRALRRVRRMSVAELASRGGLPQARISRIESGDSEPNILELFAIAQVCGVKPSWLTRAAESSDPMDIPNDAPTVGAACRCLVDGYLIAYQHAVGWRCECSKFTETGRCKHVHRVARLARPHERNQGGCERGAVPDVPSTEAGASNASIRRTRSG
jgi:transcriptional regulator with XRE-family HTH domain